MVYNYNEIVMSLSDPEVINKLKLMDISSFLSLKSFLGRILFWTSFYEEVYTEHYLLWKNIWWQHVFMRFM